MPSKTFFTMWTLQRPNKGPDKKWRLNKESKYSSLLRPKKKQEPESPTQEPPTTSFPYQPPQGGHPDLRAMDPRMVDPRIPPRIPGGGRGFDPRFINPDFVDPRPPVVPRGEPHQSDHRSLDPRINGNPKMGEAKTLDPRNYGSKTVDPRGPESRSHYSRPVGDAKRSPPRGESNSSESDDEQYRRIRSKAGAGWPGFRKRDMSMDRRLMDRPLRDQKGHHSEMDLRIKPLEDLNGREKHVERFLASLDDNREASPVPGMEVISRQRILSRSRDDLITPAEYKEDEDDVWYDMDVLIKEHVHEILKKWDQIDDGIWSKAIVFEKNRRVAKAYVRAPILTVNGSDAGFDGHRIGLRGFDNPMRDAKTLEVISRYVGPGMKIRMNDRGNIEVKKLSQYNVYVKPLGEENAISDDICKSSHLSLDSEKQVVFDIVKFEQNMHRELRKPFPNRAKLEAQCIMVLTFSKPGDLLQCPIWVMIINFVAMDMLRSKLPTGLYVPEEDPYSLTGAGSGALLVGSSGKERSGRDKPPKLPPPRDNPASLKSSGKSDYEPTEESVFRRFQLSRKNNSSYSKDKDRKYDDPYYCGLRARIPNFAKQPKGKERMDQNRPQYLPHPQMTNPNIYHSRSVDSGMAYMQQGHAPYIYKFDRNPCSMMPSQPVGYESPYSQIYGRLPLTNRPYLNPGQLHPQGFYGRDWD